MGASVTGVQPRLLFLITEDWYFWSHRLDLARLAQKNGFHVSIATRVAAHGERIRQEGFQLIPLALVRRSRNPLSELRAVAELIDVYRTVRPAIVHHVALKPILYGSVAARISKVPVVINAFAGLGYLFTERQGRGTFLRTCIRWSLKAVLAWSRSTVLFQNSDDRDLLVQDGVVDRRYARVIPGSGVDVEAFRVQPDPEGSPVVMLASRMLWDKGVGEFVEAARRLQCKGVVTRYVLVGRCDEHNPAAIDPRQIRQWVQDGIVEWWEHRTDMPAVYAQAALVVLPSYREGLPKVLLEAAACGKALIATDVPGCREVVRPGLNGLLVPPKDSAALGDAIAALLGDAPRCAAMGRASRELVDREYSVAKVTDRVIDLYRELLAAQPTGDCSRGRA